ncbi:UbiA family prenyltransferase [uncultured Chryseobacterium sp.]|uniref:UbiA family prenyltransferase n=1 Tax=uncultured Chryseobacterium sp. TaxID=259322 RepID=UPI0025FCFFB6|nr:UbiA family prenyltransferase [uncultured Chryseobacterium sp.]
MNPEKENLRTQSPASKSLFYRFSQLVGFLVGTRFFVAALLTFALYVSTFFLFNRDESFRKFVFDFKVHGIIFCTVLTILAGGIINQFYDFEKDHVVKPFRSRIQSFISQRYFLYVYLFLGIVSLGVAFVISYRVFLFFLVYQFFMWFYSHKLSRILILNNLTFVSLTLYPFFGMMVYYETFSWKVLLMAVFLFLVLLCIDIVKDTLTRSVDKAFGYHTIPNSFQLQTSKMIIAALLIVIMGVSVKLIDKEGISGIMGYYFEAGLFVMAVCIYLMIKYTRKTKFITLNILRFWVFIGILAMLLNGIENKL